MDQHLYLIYFFSAFTIGVTCFGLNLGIYLRGKASILRDYLFFHLAFTLVVVAKLLLVYVATNMPDLGQTHFAGLEYLESFIAKYLFMFALPYFTHSLFRPKFSARLNLLFGILVGLTFLAQHGTEFSGNEAIDQMGDWIERVVMAIIVLYCMLVSVRTYQPLREETSGYLMRRFVTLLVLFSPALLVDLFVEDFPIRFYPLCYIALCLSATHHFLHDYLGAPLLQPEPSIDSCRPFGISDREREVVALVLRGYSNQDVADTLHISLSTVKTHVRNIFQKCDVSSRYALLALFQNERPK